MVQHTCWWIRRLDNWHIQQVNIQQWRKQWCRLLGRMGGRVHSRRIVKNSQKEELKSSAEQWKMIEHCVICNNKKTLCSSLSPVSIWVLEAEHVLGVISNSLCFGIMLISALYFAPGNRTMLLQTHQPSDSDSMPSSVQPLISPTILLKIICRVAHCHLIMCDLGLLGSGSVTRRMVVELERLG